MEYGMGRSVMSTLDQKRAKLHAQLLKEFNGEPTVKKTDKQSVSLQKQESPRSKFLKKPGNKVNKEDRKYDMPALAPIRYHPVKIVFCLHTF